MTFARRFRYYLIGVGIGFILVFFIFKGRGFSWLPGNRVLLAVQESTLYADSHTQCLMDCYSISKNDVYDLLENGTVNFKKSNTRGEEKEYLIENDFFSVSFLRINDSTARLGKVKKSIEKECNCGEVSGQSLTLFTVPDERVFARLTTLEFEFTKRAVCQSECLMLNKISLNQLSENGKIEHKLSLPRRSPNPLYCILVAGHKGNTAYMVEQGKEKARVLQVLQARDIPEQGIVLENNCSCD